MERDEFEAEISLLLNEMETQPEDRHELWLVIREKLNEMRAMGMPVPEKLVEFERALEAEFAGAAKPEGGKKA